MHSYDPAATAYKYTLALCLFCIGAVITGNSTFRYKLIEPILEHSQFPGSFDQWDRRGDPNVAAINGGGLSLKPSDTGAIGGLYRQFELNNAEPNATQALRVTGQIARTSADPNAINLTMDQGTIAVLDFALDKTGGREVHILLDITHAKPDNKIDVIIPIPDPALAVSLGFLHRDAADSAIGTNFKIQRVVERKAYRWTLLPILILGVLLLYQFLKLAFIKFDIVSLLSVLISASILLLLLLPGAQGFVSNGYNQLQQTAWSSVFPPSLDIFSAGHTLIFAILAILAWRLADTFQQTKLLTLLQIVLVTIASEGVQQHIAGRTASVDDLEFNVLGVAIGTLLFFLAKRLPRIAKSVH